MIPIINIHPLVSGSNNSQETLHDRLSFPFFFDPNFNVEVRPIVPSSMTVMHDAQKDRWDRASVHKFRGTYDDYILNKVSKVFPELRRQVL